MINVYSALVTVVNNKKLCIHCYFKIKCGDQNGFAFTESIFSESGPVNLGNLQSY